MKVLLHTTEPVSDDALKVMQAAKEESGVQTTFEFGSMSDDMVPAPHVPVLSLGAYQRRGGERVVTTYSVPQIMSKADSLTRLIHAFKALAGEYALPEFKYVVIRDDEDLEAFRTIAGSTGAFAVDIETKGDVNSQIPSWEEIISISFYDGKMAYVFPEDRLESDRADIQAAIESSVCILANGKFDLKYLGAQPARFEDTMLQHYALYPAASSHGLKELSHEVFGAEDWDKEMKKKHLRKAAYNVHTDLGEGAYAQVMEYTSQNGYERIPREELYLYNAWDTFYTYWLWTVFNEELKNDPSAERLYREHLIPLSGMFQDIESHGLRFDVDYMAEFAETLTQEGIVLEKELNTLAGREINPRSPKQVKEWFEEQGVRLVSTNEESMKAQAGKGGLTGEFATKLLEIRKNTKTNGTYISGYLKQTIKGRGYPTYKLHASITGRLGGGGPSMLTIPRDSRIKRMVLPDEGQVLVASDLSQAELRVMATTSDDPWMIGAFQPDAGDFFDNLISNTYPNMDVQKFHEDNPGEYKDLRARFKGVVYGVSFGRGANAIAQAINVDKDEAQHLIDAYVRPGSPFAEWRKEIVRKALGGEVIENVFGRKYQAEVITNKMRGNIERSALSFISQSTANDICLLAAMNIHKRLSDEYPSARIMGTIHDAIYVTCNKSEAKEIGWMLSSEMQKAGKIVYDDTVAFESVPEVGPNLGETKEFPEIGW